MLRPSILTTATRSHVKDFINGFFSFLQTRFCEENLWFWVACCEYQATKNERDRWKVLSRIQAEFVGRNAPHWVNLSSHDVEEITYALNAEPNLLLHAEGAVWGMLQQHFVAWTTAIKEHDDDDVLPLLASNCRNYHWMEVGSDLANIVPSLFAIETENLAEEEEEGEAEEEEEEGEEAEEPNPCISVAAGPPRLPRIPAPLPPSIPRCPLPPPPFVKRMSIMDFVDEIQNI